MRQHRFSTSVRSSAVLAAFVLLAPPGAGSGPSRPAARVAEGEEAPPGRWEVLDGPRRGGLWAGFEARFGPGWSVWFDTLTGSPSLLVGPGIPEGGPLAADDPGIARARARLEELADLFGVADPSDFALERAVSVRNPFGHEIVTINFKQTWKGFDVWHQSRGGSREHLAMVKFVFDGTLGRIVLLGSDAVPALSLPDAVRLGEGEAAGEALRSLAGEVLGIEKVEVRSYVSVRAGRAFLARDVEVITAGPPHDLHFIFDAHTGALEERRDDLRHVNVVGNVSAGSWNFPGAGGTFSVKPARSLQVSVAGGGSGMTDANGNFDIPHGGTTPVTISGRFLGSWASVSDSSGNGNLSFAQVATPGIPAGVVLNPSAGAEFETAEAAGYHWTTATHYFVLGRHTSYPGRPGLPVNVNIANTCNAFWNGSSINFFRAGGSCNNTASQDVVAHEYGHAYHARWHGSTNPGGFSEGIGDHLGLYLTGQRMLGRGFFTSGAPVRDYRSGGGANNTQWPCTGCSVHKRGEVWAGATMDVRDNLVARHGPAVGVDIAERITIAQYSSNPADEVAAVTGTFIQDDNDGNLSNGTPNCSEIRAGFARHSLPIPAAIPASCGGGPPPAACGLYRTPVAEASLNSSGMDYQPTLDSSLRTIWFSSNRAGGFGGQDVWTSTRASVAGAWSVPANAGSPLNSSSNEYYISVSGDGLNLYVSSDRPGGAGGDDLWLSTRPTTGSPWGAPANLSPLNSSGIEDDPAISSDGLEIFFTSDRSGSLGGAAIWRATRAGTGSPWGAPVRVAELDSPQFDHSPAISDDGLRLYFSSDRPGGIGSSDFWLATRTARGQPFGVVRNVTEINTGQWDFNGDETSDGFSFYYSQTLSTSNSDLYRADLTQPVLLGPSSIRVGQVLTLRLRRDPGNVGGIVLGFAPIPPLPVPGVTCDLLISLFGSVVLVIGAHDPNGLVTHSSVIPPVPGAILYFQGVSQDGAGGLHLSNRVTTSVTP